MTQKLIRVNRSVAQCAFESESVNLIVAGKDDSPTVRMLHFDVTAFAMNFNEAHPLQRSMNLPAR